MNHTRLFFVLFAALFFSFFPQQSYAQQGAGITIIPATIEEGAEPGATLNQVIKITNESDEDKQYYIYKKNITGVEAGNIPVFADESAEKTGFELSEWIQIPSDPISVPAKQSYELPITIQVPEAATPGSHFGGIFVSAEPPKLRQTGAGVGYEVGSMVIIRIAGAVVDAAQIRSFYADKIINSSKNVTFNATIENKGNILIRPRGSVEIKGMFSTKPVVLPVNDSLAGVFPGAMRDLTFAWEDEGLGFGKYEAVLALSYDGDGGQKTIDAVATFWIFPTKMILGILGGFIGIILLGYFGTKYYIHQAVMRAAGGRRIVPQRYRKQVGVSRFTFIVTSLMVVAIIFLLFVLILVA